MTVQPNEISAAGDQRLLSATVIIASLGYLVDMYDMFVFNIVRTTSLTDLGLTGTDLTHAGLSIANCQWTGLLLGAYFWGVLGDRIGRKKALLSSVIIYSLGSLFSGCVVNVPTYMLARFITGLGLAGEMGSGIALITERLHFSKRTYGILVFLLFSFIGILAGTYLGTVLPWRSNYIIGAVGGGILLLLRFGLPESTMYLSMKEKTVIRGGLRIIFSRKDLCRKYLSGLAILLPGVFVPQILWTLSPELSMARGLTTPASAPIVLGLGFTTVIVVDIIAAVVTEKYKSRKLASLVFLLLGIPAFAIYLFWPVHSITDFYVINCFLAVTFGLWLVNSTWLAENFGTNIRATVATTTPNFTRALTVPMNFAFASMRHMGLVPDVACIGIVVFLLGLLGWFGLPETWGHDIDYVES
jgi:MFS transporter, putative metabolite:H+ symporter